MKRIVFGGAFNPPTIAHYEIINYLLDKFPDYELLVMPTNSFYNKNGLAPFNSRIEMLEIMKKRIDNDRLIISDLENRDERFMGTYNTLKELNHPLFVIGADSLNTLSKWIKGPELIKENTFIVFPRPGYDINEILNRKDYKEYKKNFMILDDFPEYDISSTQYRNGLEEVVFSEINDYIKKNKLYV